MRGQEGPLAGFHAFEMGYAAMIAPTMLTIPAAA